MIVCKENYDHEEKIIINPCIKKIITAFIAILNSFWKPLKSKFKLYRLQF